MTIKNFKRGPSKGKALKLARMSRELEAATTSLADEAAARALENIFPTPCRDSQYTVRLIAFFAIVGFCTWCFTK